MTSLAVAGLAGRDRELSTLEGALRRIVAGRGGVVWITGEPGIGKTSLVAALTAAAAGAGFAVRAGGGDELTAAFPLRLMADCLDIGVDCADPAAVEIAHLMRGDPGAPVVADPVAAVAERMLGVVDRLCAAGPLVLVAEDLHWADQPSLGLWSRLARSTDQIPLLLVGSCRPVPSRPVLQRLSVAVQELGGVLMELGPLSQADTVAAAYHLLGAQPGPRLSAELARTGGNPLYVRELVTALRHDGSITMAGADAELVHTVDVVPQSLMAAIGRQLSFLSEPTRRALRLASVLGAEFGAAEWAHVVGQSAVQLADVVQDAIDSGVIAAGEHGLRFRHDLIRQVLLEETPAPVRDEIHRHVARTLAGAGYRADVVARHLLATPTLDDWTLTWLAEASEASLHAAPQAYESMLQRAYDMLNDPDDPRWEALASRLAQTQFWLAHDEGAEQAATAVLRRTTDKELAGRMTVQAVRSAGRRYQYERALALAEEAIADPGMPAHWQTRLRPWKAMALLMLGRAGEATAIANEALSQARECQDELGTGYAYHALLLADPTHRRALGDAAMKDLGHDPESAQTRLLVLLDHLEVLVEDGAADEADALMVDAMVTGERLGPAGGGYVWEWAAAMHYLLGDWDEALRYYAMVPVDTHQGHRGGQCRAAEIALRRDQRERAEAHLRAAGLPDQADGPVDADVIAELTVPLSIRAHADGDPKLAFALGKYLLDHPLPLVMGRTFGPDLVRVALELGEVPTAEAAAAWVANSPFPELAGVRICQALIDDDTDALLSSAEEYRQRGWRPYRAFALEEAAVRLARAGTTEPARAALTSAVQIYADLGATMDVRRVDSRLRAHGIRRGPRSIRHRPTHGWEALTPGELRIARLAAEGLSNPDIAARLYVSRGTVQTHVSNILAKLRMASRIELIKQHATLDRESRRPASD